MTRGVPINSKANKRTSPTHQFERRSKRWKFKDTKYWNRNSEIPGSNIPPPPSYEESRQDVTGNFSYREHQWKKSPDTGIFIPVVEQESPPVDGGPPSDQNESETSFFRQLRRTVVSLDHLSAPTGRTDCTVTLVFQVPQKFLLSQKIRLLISSAIKRLIII